jgi:hypothetical protein
MVGEVNAASLISLAQAEATAASASAAAANLSADEALASEIAAATSALAAYQSETDAYGSASIASAAAQAAASSVGVFVDTPAFLAAASEGEYGWVAAGPLQPDLLLLYRELSGVAVAQGAMISSYGVTERLPDYAPEGYSWAVLDGDTNAAVGVRTDGTFEVKQENVETADFTTATGYEIGTTTAKLEEYTRTSDDAFNLVDLDGNAAFRVKADGGVHAAELTADVLISPSGDITALTGHDFTGSSVGTLGGGLTREHAMADDAFAISDPDGHEAIRIRSDGTFQAAELVATTGTIQTLDADTTTIRLVNGVPIQPIIDAGTAGLDLYDWAGNVFNVRDFGATGDGVTDDTAAMQAAVDAAYASTLATGGGALVRAPAGIYVLTEPGIKWYSGTNGNSATPYSRVSFRGDGPGETVLKMTGAAGTNFCAINGSQFSGLFGTWPPKYADCHFRDFEVDGSQLSGVTFNVFNKGISFYPSQRTMVSNVYVHDTPATGIAIDYCVDATISNCILDGCGRLGTTTGSSGIGIGSGWYPVESCTIVNVHAVDNMNCGIFFERQSDGSDATYKTANISNCVCRGNRTGIGDMSATHYQISNCLLVDNLQYGFELTQTMFQQSTGLEGVLENCQIHRNTLAGVRLRLRKSTGVEWMRGYTVRNNSISDNGTHGILLEVPNEDVENIKITGNRIFDNDECGIYVSGGTYAIKDFNINHNQIWRNGQDTGATYRDGIRIATPITDLSVVGNKVFDPQSSKTQQNGIVLGAYAITRGTIVGNDVRTNVVAGLATTATLTDVVITQNPGYNGGASDIDFPHTADPVFMVNGAGLVGGSNRAYYLRCLGGGVISKITVQVAVQNGNVDVAVYRNSGLGRSAVPGARLTSSGSVACPAVGVADISLAATVEVLPGDWLAISTDSATASFRTAGTSSLVGSAMGNGRAFYQNTAFPLPATPSSLNAYIGGQYVLLGTP